jgi:DNA-binding transcriptional LysR family regulator
MDLLAAFRTFVRITETGSFSAVAREAGSTQPAVSRQLAALEEYLGVRLFQRSTRSLHLTEDGQDLLGRARMVIEAVEETESAVGRRRTSPAGLVRVGCPSVFGRVWVAPRIGRLLERFPDLAVELVISDEVADMIQEGLDLVVRIGEITDPALISRRIGATTSVAFAAPAYLAAHGEPQHPSELPDHDCIVFSRGTDPDLWTFNGDEGPISVHVCGRFRASGIESVLAAAVAGLGIVRVPLWMVRDPLNNGSLVPILRRWQAPPRPISAVYPSRRFLAPRVRAVIDYLVEEFRDNPIGAMELPLLPEVVVASPH